MGTNIIDILLVLLMLLFVLHGWRRGLILGLLDLIRWLGSLFAALIFYHPVARFLSALFGLSDVWAQPLAFMLVLILTSALIQSLGFGLLRRVPKETHERRSNRLLGLLPGAANGLIFAVIVAALLLSLPLPESLSEPARASRMTNRLAVYAERIESELSPIFGEAVRQTLNRLTVEPGSSERIDLPFTVSNPRPRPDLEAQMLELVNQERAAAGLTPLAPDPELVPTARRHSTDMFARGYFSHISPEGRSPFDRIRADNISFLTAGENLALARSVQVAHAGLMNSPGHRANILRPQFGRVGIGIMDGGLRGLMVTQKFRN